MNWSFYVFAGFVLLIFQTAVIPYISILDGFYDLLIPFTLYLSIFHPSRETVFVILVMGFIMDNLSGGPFGLYCTTYLWLFIGVGWMVTFLHATNRLLISFVVAAGVILENTLLYVTLTFLSADSYFPLNAFRIVTVQFLWALCTGPFLIAGLNFSHKKWNVRMNKIFFDENGDG